MVRGSGPMITLTALAWLAWLAWLAARSEQVIANARAIGLRLTVDDIQAIDDTLAG